MRVILSLCSILFAFQIAFGKSEINEKQKVVQPSLVKGKLENEITELQKDLIDLQKKYEIIYLESIKSSSELASFSSRYDDWRQVFLIFLSGFGVLSFLGYRIILNRVAFEAEKEFSELRIKMVRDYEKIKKLTTKLEESSSKNIVEDLETIFNRLKGI